jgi:hypothetical protein
LPSLPWCVGAPLTVVAPGVAVACSVFWTLEGGEGSIEFLRSCAVAGGFTDVARGGLIGWLDQMCALVGDVAIHTPTRPLRLQVALL